jgi:hypothetical protein
MCFGAEPGHAGWTPADAVLAAKLKVLTARGFVWPWSADFHEPVNESNPLRVAGGVRIG